MLNIIEKSDVLQFIETVEDERMKDLLSRMCFEYESYTHVGTPDECQRYKDWSDLRPSDYMRLLDNCTKALKDELECTKKFYEKELQRVNNKVDNCKRAIRKTK